MQSPLPFFRERLAQRFDMLSDFQTPEILSAPLQEHVLGILCDIPEETPAEYLEKAMHPPDSKKVRVSALRVHCENKLCAV